MPRHYRCIVLLFLVLSCCFFTLLFLQMPYALWTDKFKPTDSSSFCGPEYLKRLLGTKNLPHLLLYGPPGTGKTTYATLISSGISSNSTTSTSGNNTLYLNGSDERGIAVIRNTVKKFAQFAEKKFIILDECENLTYDSQTCLRRILEDYNSTTFIFITNYYNRIIDPIKSRCLKIKFTNRSREAIDKLTETGVEREIVEYTYDKCEGDIRRTLNILQGMNYSGREYINNGNSDKDGINSSGTTKSNKIACKELVDFFVGDVPSQYLNNIDYIKENNYSVLQYIRQLMEKNENPRVGITLGELEMKATRGCSEEIIYEALREIVH